MRLPELSYCGGGEGDLNGQLLVSKTMNLGLSRTYHHLLVPRR